MSSLLLAVLLSLPIQTAPAFQHYYDFGVLRGHEKPIRAVALSPDTMTVATACEDGTVRIWSRDTLKTLRTIPAHTKAWAVQFSRDGKELFSGGLDGFIRRWDVETGSKIAEYHTKERVLDLRVSPDGKSLAAAVAKDIEIWDVETGTGTRVLAGHRDWVAQMAYSPDGATLASACYDGTVRVWSAANGTLKHVLKGHTGFVKSVAISADGSTVASGGSDHTLRTWNLATGELRKVVFEQYTQVTALAFMADSDRIVVGNYGAGVQVWTALSDKPVDVMYNVNVGAITTMVLSKNGRIMVVAGFDNRAAIYGY